MKLILSHQSALDFWMSGSMLGSVSVSRSKLEAHVLPASFGAALSAADAKDLLDRYPLTLPIHTLVSSANLADNRPGMLATHVWANPAYSDSFYRLAPDLYVCSPELTYVQMAATLSVPELIKLGFDLCGTYRLGKEGTEYGQEPLTDVPCLLKAAELHRGKTGVSKACQAAKFIRNNSASPRETALAMLVGLPSRYGGASFGMPVMNHPINLDPEARMMANRTKCICDLYFPLWRLDLEYEGYEFHSGSAKMEQDSLRRDALSLMDVSVITVTNRQIVEFEKFNGLIKLISRTTGKRFRPQCANFELKQRKLWSLLSR